MFIFKIPLFCIFNFYFNLSVLLLTSQLCSVNLHEVFACILREHIYEDIMFKKWKCENFLQKKTVSRNNSAESLGRQYKSKYL